MRPREVLRSALRGMGSNPLRSILTVLGVLIGVGSVILLVAVGNGSSKEIQANIDRLGTNTLTVFSGQFGFGAASSGPEAQNQQLTLTTAQALANKADAPDVKSVTPEVTGAETLTYGSASESAEVVGTYPSYFAATNSPVSQGTYFTDSDVTGARNVAVIGDTLAQDLFGTANPIGKQINMGGQLFTVNGVLANKGSSGLANANDIVIAPLSTVQQELTGFGPLSQIILQATSPGTVNAADGEATAILDQQLQVTNSASSPFQILNQSQLLSTSTKTASTFTVLLGAVAGISLLVGGIGITNIMLVTVTERTREIGILKALGAPRGAILAQFLAEATLLSLVGGGLGVLAGLVGATFKIDGVHPAVEPYSIALAFGVSLVIGLFFGGYPANRAAGLRPVEALRHE